ncbi:MAG: hypothetical protein JWR80_3243 [Bradyrhizobium sp.]|nr:hypothetical protein [Bradyrhizobium sp.]
MNGPLLLMTAILAGSGIGQVRELEPKKDIVFNGGPLDKIAMGPVGRSNGKAVFGLKPSAANVSPVPAPQQVVIAGFIDAYRRGAKGGLRQFLSANATGTWCEGPMVMNCMPAAPFEDMPFGEHCSANTPFYQGGADVRLEWIYKRRLYYISFVRFDGDKIASIVTTRATMPQLTDASRFN